MSNKLSRIYIGAICNRDLEIFDKIKKFCSKNYNISIINLLKKDSNTFNAKYFKKQIKKYPISFIIVKLYSEESNQEIYKTIREIAPSIPLLNNARAVEICESRTNTFKFIQQSAKKLNIPKTYYSIKEAYNACSNGNKVIIKLDTHNIPDLPKNDRIIGIAENVSQFDKLVENYRDEDLFFQAYLGSFDIIYKIYVIDRWAVSITSHNRLRENENLTPLELIHIRIPIDKQLKRRILRLGRKMGMPIFGVDYILTKEGIPYIIDINDFPSFRSIPEAVSLLSDYIYNMVALQRQLFKTTARVRG
ncbi:MAG: hypothetical protein JSV23_10275 [Promethearchaeota archaeon]|nr:MAG: hypothetical protein JSV23_10275 [Candidatus Lokiarchaeota archaeon]